MLPGTVVLAVTPSATTANVGQAFSVTLQVQAGAQQVDGSAAYLDFNPAVLQVVSITPGSALSVVLQNQFNNTLGTLDFSAGALSNFPSGTFTLATVQFNPIGVANNSPLTFHLTAPRHSDATFGGVSVLGSTVNGTVTVVTNATLNGAVAFQGGSAPPSSRWSVPLRVNLTPQGGGAAIPCNPTSDASGNFTCPNIAPAGNYTACVKHSHTLQNCQSIALGGAAVNFGTLKEGDANDDNCVALVDFSILVTTFGKCTGDAGFDARADFDLSGCVVLVDFSLLASNFGTCGQMASSPPPPAAGVTGGAAITSAAGGGAPSRSATLALKPANTKTTQGKTFTVAITMQAGTQLVDGAEAHLNFDPSVLQVVRLNTGKVLPVPIQSTFSNTEGTIDYSAGTFSNFPTGTFTVATVTFTAIAASPETPLTFSTSAPRRSDVTFGGTSVRSSTPKGAVTVKARPGGRS